MQYAICNETFAGWEWEATCRQVAEIGYTGIEVAPFTLAEDVRALGAQDRRHLAETTRRAGLEVIGLHWLLVSPKGLSLTSNDTAIREETARYLAALVDFCADLGGHILVLGSPAQRRIPEGQSVETALARLAACLEPALTRADVHDVVLCLEPLPPPEADLILTMQEAVTILRRIDHPKLRTIFDVKSASSEGVPLPDLIQAFTPYLAHVHANDANRRGPGFGETDFIPILTALHETGFAGAISVEVFDYTPDPITIARESLRYLCHCEAAVLARS
ncbi:MAG TPA: sugar phosphate isomerase/epimerase family protein [Chthonomonadaceae bacterium]|nr:sugar phosphate isomerase/epimerase family protein [Chthonomonadaceae bacterium]